MFSKQSAIANIEIRNTDQILKAEHNQSLIIRIKFNLSLFFLELGIILCRPWHDENIFVTNHGVSIGSVTL
jgi:hypothetical protein